MGETQAQIDASPELEGDMRPAVRGGECSQCFAPPGTHEGTCWKRSKNRPGVLDAFRERARDHDEAHIGRMAPDLLDAEDEMRRWLKSVEAMMAETEPGRLPELVAKVQRPDLSRLMEKRLLLQQLRRRLAETT